VAGVFVFLAKTYGFFFVMVALRGALPRLRIDQLMDFGWKFLIPITMVNIVSAALWLGITQWGAAQGLGFVEGWGGFARWGLAFVVTLVINVAAFWLLVRINQRTGTLKPTLPTPPSTPVAAGSQS
jgi:NADH-quinone oxidoreductase subunit H